MNEYLIELQARLDEMKSKGLINADIDKLQNQINTLKLQAELDPNIMPNLAGQFEEALRSIGIEVRKADGELQDFNVTMGELAKQWDTLSAMQKFNIASGLTGSGQTDAIQALLRSWSAYENQVNKASDSTGTALKSQETSAESLSETLEELSSVWEDISGGDIDASFLKGLADAGAAISSLTEKIGILKTAAGLGLVGLFNKGRSNTILPSMGVTPYCKL